MNRLNLTSAQPQPQPDPLRRFHAFIEKFLKGAASDNCTTITTVHECTGVCVCECTHTLGHYSYPYPFLHASVTQRPMQAALHSTPATHSTRNRIRTRSRTRCHTQAYRIRTRSQLYRTALCPASV